MDVVCDVQVDQFELLSDESLEKCLIRMFEDDSDSTNSACNCCNCNCCNCDRCHLQG